MHLTGLCLVIVFSFVWFTRSAVDGQVGLKTKIMSLVNHQKNTDICALVPRSQGKNTSAEIQIIGQYQNNPQTSIEATKHENTWDIYLTDKNQGIKTIMSQNIFFSGKIFSHSYQPIYDQFVFPSCDEKTCLINIWSINDQKISRSFTAVDSQGSPRVDIDNLFFDLEHSIISYTTPSTDFSSRIVIDADGKLLQSIDETPGINRTLNFLGYEPQTQTMIYYDPTAGIYDFYSANSILLRRARCN